MLASLARRPSVRGSGTLVNHKRPTMGVAASLIVVPYTSGSLEHRLMWMAAVPLLLAIPSRSALTCTQELQVLARPCPTRHLVCFLLLSPTT